MEKEKELKRTLFMVATGSLVIILAIGVYATFLKRELNTALHNEAEFQERLTTLITLIPANSGAWWRQGCMHSVQEKELEAQDLAATDDGLDRFLSEMKCEQKASAFEAEVKQAIFGESQGEVSKVLSE